MLARPLAVDYDLNGRLLIYPLTRVVLRCTRGAHLCFDRQGKRKQLATAVKERGRGAKMEEGGYPPFWALSIRRTQRQLLCYVSSGELPPFMTITLCPPITDDVSIPQIKYSNACVMSSIIRHICLVLKLLKISFFFGVSSTDETLSCTTCTAVGSENSVGSREAKRLALVNATIDDKVSTKCC